MTTSTKTITVSIGPRNHAGNKESARNAAKHGLLNKHLIIDGEKREDYNRLQNRLLASYQPANASTHKTGGY